jgi:hypothetical protein
MSVIMGQLSIAAAGSTNNLLAGSAFELAVRQELVSIGCTASVTGGFIGITVGSDLVLEDTPPFVSAAYPIIPDQMFYNDVANPGDRIVIRARNPSGGAIVFNFVVQISAIK